MTDPSLIDQFLKLAPVATAVIGAAFAGLTLLRALRWKRAEFASSYLKELTQNPELVFACRAIDWQGGQLVVPDSLIPLLNGKRIIEHDPAVFEQAVDPFLTIGDALADPRLQVYRTALDDLLSWFSVLSNAIDQKLFRAKDLPELGYWVRLLLKRAELSDFIDAFNYRASLNALNRSFERRKFDRREENCNKVQRT